MGKSIQFKSSSTSVTVNNGNQVDKTIYEISASNFTVLLATNLNAHNHGEIQRALRALGVALAEEASLTQHNVEEAVKKHLAALINIELAVLASSEGGESFHLLTGRFYNNAGSQINAPKFKTDSIALRYTTLDVSEPFNWKSGAISKDSIKYTSTSPQELMSGSSIKAAELAEMHPSLLTTPPFPKKAVIAGGAIAAIAIAAMVMTFTAKYAGSHAVVSLVGIKAMSLFWPIALGVGSALVLGSLYNYKGQGGLFNCSSKATRDDMIQPDSHKLKT